MAFLKTLNDPNGKFYARKIANWNKGAELWFITTPIWQTYRGGTEYYPEKPKE